MDGEENVFIYYKILFGYKGNEVLLFGVKGLVL